MHKLALIFDFGNVFAHFSYTKACESIGQRRGISGDQLLDELRHAGLNDWVGLYESGRMTSAEFGQRVIDQSGVGLSFHEFAIAWRDIFWLNDPVVDLVAKLGRQGYPLVLGSNTNELHADHFRVQFAEALAPFDALVLSYQVGEMKPDARFYHACAQAAGRPVSECLFIDDLETNVQGAMVAGLQAIHYRDPAQLKLDLREIGVEV